MQFLTAGILPSDAVLRSPSTRNRCTSFARSAATFTSPLSPGDAFGSGVAELIASLLLLMFATAVFGALLAIGVCERRYLSHIFHPCISRSGRWGLLCCAWRDGLRCRRDHLC